MPLRLKVSPAARSKTPAITRPTVQLRLEFTGSEVVEAVIID
jgi:hypothetical protein